MSLRVESGEGYLRNPLADNVLDQSASGVKRVASLVHVDR